MGERVAHLVTGKMIDFIEFDDGFAIVKTRAPREAEGRTLAECALRSKYGVTVVGVKRREDRLRPGEAGDADPAGRPPHRVGADEARGGVRRHHLTGCGRRRGDQSGFGFAARAPPSRPSRALTWANLALLTGRSGYRTRPR